MCISVSWVPALRTEASAAPSVKAILKALWVLLLASAFNFLAPNLKDWLVAIWLALVAPVAAALIAIDPKPPVTAPAAIVNKFKGSRTISAAISLTIPALCLKLPTSAWSKVSLR